MAEYVLQQADLQGEKPAMVVVAQDGSTHCESYTELQRAIRRISGHLAKDAPPGAHVLLTLGNSPVFPKAFLAAIAAGLVPVVVSSQLTAPEIAHVMDVVKPALHLHADDPRLHAQTGTAAPYHQGSPDRPAYIVFTSGTSGKPRAVVHAHRAIWARRMMWDGWYGLRPDDRVMHAGAFNWTYTLGTGLMDPWSIGATAVIPDQAIPAADLPQVLAATNATIFAAAPGVYRRMLRGAFPTFPHLRHGLSAGEKLDESYRRDWSEKTGTDIHEAFGMSECSTFISGSPTRPAPPGSLGFAQSGRRVAILGKTGPLPRGAQGIIAIHRSDPGLMLGYLDAKDATAERMQGEWFVTGDVGTMDETGAICFAGRSDDMMNAGGHRVSPVEVEMAMIAFDAVTEAAACAVHIRPGTSIIAGFYVSSSKIDENALDAFLATRLARYKRPRILVARQALPRGANNKLLRRVLRTEWEAEHGQT